MKKIILLLCLVIILIFRLAILFQLKCIYLKIHSTARWVLVMKLK